MSKINVSNNDLQTQNKIVIQYENHLFAYGILSVQFSLDTFIEKKEIEKLVHSTC